MSKIPRGEIKRTRPLATAAAMGDIATVKKLLALKGAKAIPNDEVIEAYTIVEDHGHQGVKTLLAEHRAVRNIYGLVNPKPKTKTAKKAKKVRFIEIEEEYQEPEPMSLFIKKLLSDTPLPVKKTKAKAKSTKAKAKSTKKTTKTVRKRPSPLKNVGGEKISEKEIAANKAVFAKLKAAKVAKANAAKRPSPLKDVGGYKLTSAEKKEVARLNREYKKEMREEVKPVKNISAFLFYKKAKEASLKKSDPHMTVKEVKKVIEVSWKTMTDKEKKPYELKAKKDEARYKKEYAAYQKGKKYSPVF
jgi:high mobility group protein B1